MSLKSLASIWRQRLNKNANKVKKKPIKPENKMSKFQFRAPPSQNPGCSRKPQVSQTPSETRPQIDDDLWADDIDEDMLIQASQLVEGMQANARIVTEEERMEMDDDVLTMFIQEEEKFDSFKPKMPKPPQVVKMSAIVPKV